MPFDFRVQVSKDVIAEIANHFWKEHTFRSDGYFACSIGEANPNTII